MNIFRVDTEELTTEQIQGLITKHKESYVPKYKKMQDYYEGKHDILKQKATDENKPNNKLVNNMAMYITDTVIGYFLGKPVVYSSDNKELMEKLQDIFDYNDEQDENIEIEKMCSTKGHGYELLYIDENEQIRFNEVEPDECILVYNANITPSPIAAIRYYSLQKDETKVEVYTKDHIYYYDFQDGGMVLTDEKEHYFKEVPVIEFTNNKERMGDYEQVISLIDAYNKIQSNTANLFQYNDNALLKLVNMSGTQPEDIAKFKDQGAILLDDKGDADWLIKQLFDTAEENYKNRLKKDIHTLSKTPNLSDESFAGQLSGVAISYKVWGLEQLAAAKERKFKRALQRRIELIMNILNFKGANYDYRDIEIKFRRNLPQNLAEKVDMVAKLKGIVDDETLLGLLDFIENPQQVLEKLKQQQEEELSDDYNKLGEMNG